MPVFAVTLVAGAFLLFLVQPLMGAFVLPWFGGAPAVWTTCMLFFQTLLLGGYAYAHGMARWSLRRQAAVHAALVLTALITLPIQPDPSWRPQPGQAPLLHILGLLTVSVGVPYLVLASTSTLLQAWAARLFQGSPYPLYAGSNAAAMAALFSYPLVFEPWLGVTAQGTAWGLGFGVFALASLASAATAWRGAAADLRPTRGPPPALRPAKVLVWIALSALPSALLLAVTEKLTADISVVPFFWILPLALYLLTFVVAFAQAEQPTPQRIAAAAALGLGCFLPGALRPHLPLITQVALGAGGLFLIALAAHTELVRRRPPPAGLTAFYLAMALGGALGGLAVAVAAPSLLPARLELPILLVLTPLALAAIHRPAAWTVAVGLGVAAASLTGQAASEVEARYRSFYGNLRVERLRPLGARGPAVRHLLDERVSHGFQILDTPRTPTGYYAAGTGVHEALLALPHPARVGLIGLGCGTLAGHGRPGDVYRFYELNPDVVEVAQTHFSFLRDSRATVSVALGDGRLLLEAEPPQGYHLLILDAFSGGAVPGHLLTDEAFTAYRRHLAPGGLLALHVSNDHLDLALLVHGQIATMGWASRYVQRRTPSPLGPVISEWVLAGPPARLSALGLRPRPPAALDEGRRAPRWTDDHRPLWPLIR